MTIGLVVLAGGLLAQIPLVGGSGRSGDASQDLAASVQLQAQLRDEMIRFGDEFIVKFGQAIQGTMSDEPDPSYRQWVREMVLTHGSAAFQIAAGDRPVVNLLDMYVMVRLARHEFEDYWLEEKWGERVRPIVDALVGLKAEIAEVADRYLTDEQRAELETSVTNWQAANPDVINTAFIRFREFASQIGQPVEKSGRRANSVFSLFYLDPLAGLDPTVRAIEQTKLFGERVMYFSQRLPFMIRWHGLVFINDAVQASEAQRVLDDIDTVSAAVESIAATAALLPGLVSTERQAAIDQVFEGIAVERQAIIEAIGEADESFVREMVTDTRLTLDSGTAMADAVDRVIGSVNELIAPDPNAPPKPPPDPDNPPPPFRILDYAETAQRIEQAAAQLDALVKTVDGSAPKLVEATAPELRRLANHIFLLAVGFVAIVFAAAILYRVVARRWFS